MFVTLPTKQEVLDTINYSNLNAAPGTDGINSLVYKVCLDTLGDSLSEVVTSIFQGATL